jgi:hypothetical protein
LNIPAAEILVLPALFAPGLGSSKGILHPYRNIVFPVPAEVGNIKGEPGIGPLMDTGKMTVDPEFRAVIASLEMEDYPLAGIFVFFYRDLPVVPDYLVWARIPNTAFGGFIGKGDHNLAGPGKSAKPFPPYPFVSVVKGKVPGTVKAAPGIGFPDKLWAGILPLVAFHGITSRIVNPAFNT